MLFLRVSVACPASSANLAVLEPTSPLLFTRRTCHYRWSPTKTTPILRSQAGACAQPAPINLAGGLARHVTATAHCDSDAAGWPQWSIGQHGAGRLGCLAAHWNDNRRDARSQRTRDSPVLMSRWRFVQLRPQPRKTDMQWKDDSRGEGRRAA